MAGGFDYQDPFRGGYDQGNAGIIRGAGQQGFFDPRGSSAFRMAMRRRLLTQGRSRQNRAGVLSRLAGLDAIGQRQAMVDTGQDVAGTTADALNNFDVGDYQQNRDYFRGLYGNALQREQGLADQRRAQRQGFWGGVGGLIGQAGIAMIPGLPWMKAAAGTRKSQQYQDPYA
jgi:hypothetical protein